MSRKLFGGRVSENGSEGRGLTRPFCEEYIFNNKKQQQQQTNKQTLSLERKYR